ncbi:MAG: hypothetical protein ACP5JP_06585 [bacterium]
MSKLSYCIFRVNINVALIPLLAGILLVGSCGVPDNIHGKSNVNTPPVITDYYPQNVNISAHDGELLNFWIIAKDPDNDILEYDWQLNGVSVSNGTYYNFVVSITQGTRQVLTVIVKDPAGLQTEKTWLINVTM